MREDLLISEPAVEHLRETLAPVVACGDVHPESIPLVRPCEIKSVLPAAEHDEEITPVLVQRSQGAAKNVQHDGGVDLVHRDGLPVHRIL